MKNDLVICKVKCKEKKCYHKQVHRRSPICNLPCQGSLPCEPINGDDKELWDYIDRVKR